MGLAAFKACCRPQPHLLMGLVRHCYSKSWSPGEVPPFFPIPTDPEAHEQSAGGGVDLHPPLPHQGLPGGHAGGRRWAEVGSRVASMAMSTCCMRQTVP